MSHASILDPIKCLPLATEWDGETYGTYGPSSPSGGPVYGIGTGAIPITKEQFYYWALKVKLVSCYSKATFLDYSSGHDVTDEKKFPCTIGGCAYSIDYVQDASFPVGVNSSVFAYGWSPSYASSEGGTDFVVQPQTGFHDKFGSNKEAGYACGTAGGESPVARWTQAAVPWYGVCGGMNDYFAGGYSPTYSNFTDANSTPINYTSEVLNSLVVTNNYYTITQQFSAGVFCIDSSGQIYIIPYFSYEGQYPDPLLCTSYKVDSSTASLGTLTLGDLGSIDVWNWYGGTDGSIQITINVEQEWSYSA